MFNGVRDKVTRKQACIQKKRAMDIVDRLERRSYEYTAVKSQILSFDILLYRDMDPISRVIRAAESLTKGCGMFSHAALAVRGDLLAPHYPNIDPDEIYVFESTLSGYWNDNVCNIHNKTFFGVQLRPLRAQLDFPTRTIAWCPLTTTLRKGLTDEKILETVRKYDGTGYNYHIIDLITSAFPGGCCESIRDRYGHAEEGLMFCSELVAACLRHVGILHKAVKPSNVLPVDFLGPSPDVPCVVCGIVNLYPDTCDVDNNDDEEEYEESDDANDKKKNT